MSSARVADFSFDQSEFDVLVERLELGGTDLLDQTWVPDPSVRRRRRQQQLQPGSTQHAPSWSTALTASR